MMSFLLFMVNIEGLTYLMLRGNNSLRRITTEYIELSVYTENASYFPGIRRLDFDFSL